jgi:hypothetical protein
MKKVQNSLIVVLGMSLLASCGGQQNTATLLKDPKKKAEIIAALCNEPQSTADVADQLAKTAGCVQTLTANTSLIRQITSEGNLSGMLKSDTATTYNLMADLIAVSSKDSVATDRMTTLILANENLRASLHNKMHDKAKSGKEKKHKEKKEKSAHKKGKHNKE